MSEATAPEQPSPIEAFEVEYVTHDHPILVPEVRRVSDGVTVDLTTVEGGYEATNARRPSGVLGSMVLPTHLFSDAIFPSRVLDSDGGSKYRLGQVVNLVD